MAEFPIMVCMTGQRLESLQVFADGAGQQVPLWFLQCTLDMGARRRQGLLERAA